MSSSEREQMTVGDRSKYDNGEFLELLRFTVLSGLASVWTLAAIVLMFMGRMDFGLGAATITANLNIFVSTSSGKQRKREPEQQAIAQSGGLVVQEQAPERSDT